MPRADWAGDSARCGTCCLLGKGAYPPLGKCATPCGTFQGAGVEALPGDAVKRSPVAAAGVDPATTVQQFQELLLEKTGVSPAAQEVLAGFPPRPLQVPYGGGGRTGGGPMPHEGG